ncbi:putative Cytochrome b561 family protein [Bradyrhizobium sp. ORS 285]|uniref:cytochrome b/b6 domain-containing protein n=1 Tax=Bradyrhizobium sp. ORS 285 TaxID=115808 RepID=UPI0002E25930|nr:cytochrome b/b6 domain-containing protein [Bradyrhizobium sp. ORS 285]SMX57147.1 putative Cytochrome b561 family protein [Bradyrhizobium sp. ORS 285]
MHGTAPRSSSKDPDQAETVLVWDLPLRLWHWMLAALVVVAGVTPNVYDGLHRVAGYAILGLLTFRLIWGVLGTRHSRFRSLRARLRATPAYLWNLRRGKTGRYLGLNPAGTAMQLVLLLVLIVSAVTGAMQVTVRFFGVWWVEDTHEITSYLLIPLVVLHVAGVVLVSRLQGENLARAMLTGRKLLRRTMQRGLQRQTDSSGTQGTHNP